MTLNGHDDNEITRALRPVINPGIGQECAFCGLSFHHVDGEAVRGTFPTLAGGHETECFCSEQCGNAWHAKHREILGLAE